MSSFQQYLIDHWQAQFTGDHCLLPNSSGGLDDLVAETTVTPLCQYGFLSVTGPDAQTFLQGQTTCDFRRIDGAHSSPGAYCTPKGRMLATFHSAALNTENYLLRMRRDLVDSTRGVLGKYIVFSKADMRDSSDDWVGLGIAGEHARERLQALFPELPSERFGCIHAGDGLLIQLDEGQRFECWLPTERAREFWELLASQATPASSTLWELLNIRAGLGDVCAATRELFVPQVINFEVTGGVSFKKGCYTGQEVVARLHYRGKSKRRMYPAILAAPAPSAGSELYVDDQAQSIGHVVAAVDCGEHSELLVSITSDSAETGNIHLEGRSESLSVQAPPYSLEED